MTRAWADQHGAIVANDRAKRDMALAPIVTSPLSTVVSATPSRA